MPFKIISLPLLALATCSSTQSIIKMVQSSQSQLVLIGILFQLQLAADETELAAAKAGSLARDETD